MSIVVDPVDNGVGSMKVWMPTDRISEEDSKFLLDTWISDVEFDKFVCGYETIIE